MPELCAAPVAAACVRLERGRPEGGAANAALLLLPQERTFTGECPTAEKGQKETNGTAANERLFDHLVGGGL
jgi:hypothetical protein